MFKFCIQSWELCILPESHLKSNSVRNFSENPPVLEFILNFFFCWQNFLKIAFKTLRTERKQHAKNETILPSESGNNAAGSFKFLNSLTRQGRQLRMLRGCTRERTRKTHGTFYFVIFLFISLCRLSCTDSTALFLVETVTFGMNGVC